LTHRHGSMEEVPARIATSSVDTARAAEMEMIFHRLNQWRARLAFSIR